MPHACPHCDEPFHTITMADGRKLIGPHFLPDHTGHCPAGFRELSGPRSVEAQENSLSKAKGALAFVDN